MSLWSPSFVHCSGKVWFHLWDWKKFLLPRIYRAATETLPVVTAPKRHQQHPKEGTGEGKMLALHRDQITKTFNGNVMAFFFFFLKKLGKPFKLNAAFCFGMHFPS